jgi:chromosome condensin MukBEF ATPase and DNA-binding subunit MukB
MRGPHSEKLCTDAITSGFPLRIPLKQEHSRHEAARYEEHLKEFPDRIERDNCVVEGAREEHLKNTARNRPSRQIVE